MARARGDGQHLRDDVEVGGGEERRLLGVAILVLIERGVVALDPRDSARYVPGNVPTFVRQPVLPRAPPFAVHAGMVLYIQAVWS